MSQAGKKIVSMWSPRTPQGSVVKCAFSLCDVTSLRSPRDHRGGRDGSGLCRVPSAPCESGAVLGLSLPQGHDWVFHPQPRIFSKGKQALIHSHCRGGVGGLRLRNPLRLSVSA